ncbi:MAG: beta-ketoacyl-[acyl-carrier-protein] synthase family protein [Candidatus Omnitrophica bacterium]|nr:beta-ketoacyl-[acyl-carrier-protein] synthase family protein [Candidatus Omnitrophota bacterium]MBU1924349.1 beta-ketoacyl-[acyl-carrier-protein] synthase family protein [Candidatus Omnitrophota bacterium]MBU2063952.1 beta-ketoacyl-[acyl-carrier-protein] synthase family protein [Candidatus Omnitrophota bacterium]
MKMMDTDKRIVVTGMGIISSLGIGKDEFWKNLIQGKSGISKVDAFDTAEHATHFGGQVKGFDAEDFLSKNKIKMMGRASHLAIAAAKLAIKDAGLDIKKFNCEELAILLGTTAGEAQEIEEMDEIWLKKGVDAVDNWSIVQYPVSNISSNVALELKVKGKNRMFTTACAAGNYAISYGVDLIKLGKADIVFAGGSDAFSYLGFTGFNQVRAVAPEKCQPFDKNRKGMIPGEGAAILVLESLKSAHKRNAEIYAEILGCGFSCDAFHMTNPQIDGVGRCVQNALERTGVNPEDVDYICAHGTGTRHNDKTECAAINKVFGNRKVAVSSIKSMLGHTMGAASAIEAMACCLATKFDIVPPTINFETPDPECDIDCVPNKARKQKVNIALNNGFAFGGNNACLVIKKIK